MLESVQNQRISVDDALSKLANLPYEDLEYAKLDHHRSIRRGYPEVVFCQGKTVGQVQQIVLHLAAQNNVLATRATPEMFAAVQLLLPHARYNELGRTITVAHLDGHVEGTQTEDAGAGIHPEHTGLGAQHDRSGVAMQSERHTAGTKPENNIAATHTKDIGSEIPPSPGNKPDKHILVISAGTADLPVAEEAVETARFMGNQVKTLYDVGVAGIHRLLGNKPKIDEAAVLIVVAGMDGALPSVVGGLVERPVIAVPTSVGYGASFGGIAPLLTMLNACAPGIAVVNIDNGFGAAYIASLIIRTQGVER